MLGGPFISYVKLKYNFLCDAENSDPKKQHNKLLSNRMSFYPYLFYFTVLQGNINQNIFQLLLNKLSFPSGKNKKNYSRETIAQMTGFAHLFCFLLFFTECIRKIKWDSQYDYSTGFYNIFLNSIINRQWQVASLPKDIKYTQKQCRIS